MGISYGPNKVEEIGIVQDGLVFWVHASAVSSYGGSGTTWSDIKGNNDLTMDSNVTFDTTYNPTTAKCMDFAGSGASNQVTCPSFTITSGTVWSQQCFYKPSNQESGGYGYFNKLWCAISEGGTANGSTKRLYLFIDGSTAQPISTTQFETDTWYNIGWVFNSNNTVKTYVNGVLDQTTTVSGTINWPTTTFTGLGQYNGSTHHLNGKLGNFMIYDRELTASEFLKNFNTERIRYGI